MFSKISFLKLFVDFKLLNLISVLVLVMISTSVDCQSNDSICDFIVRDGRVRDLGIYRFVSNERFSYRLFSREIEGEFNIKQKLSVPIAEEHELEIENWKVSAQSSTIKEFYGSLKFYVGSDKFEPYFEPNFIEISPTLLSGKFKAIQSSCI